MLSFWFLTGALAGDQPTWWPRYSRPIKLLDSDNWDFFLMSEKSVTNFDSLSPEFDPSKVVFTNKTVVPSSWDGKDGPGINGTMSVGFFRTFFEQRSDNARIQFMGCSKFCRVYVDGVEVGANFAGGYVPFYVDLPPATKPKSQKRELFVLVDNRFNSTTAPMHTGGDFWHYSGIVRSVVFHEMPASNELPYIWRTYVFPHKDDPTTVDLRVVLTDPKFSGEYPFKYRFDHNGDRRLEEEELGVWSRKTSVTGQAKNGVIEVLDVKVVKAKLWTLEDPQLTKIALYSDNGHEQIIERFGCRAWGTDGKGRITLNGEVVKLHGWNHHTQWMGTGMSFTMEQANEDLKLLRLANANYVRGAHYPQDQRWLDRLDDLGFAMWEETCCPNPTVEDYNDPRFMKYQVEQVNNMLDASMNHPSIMTWGWFNEGPSKNESSKPAYKAMADLVSEKDPTRFWTWASNQIKTSQHPVVQDVCLEYASLISFNSYPAWYEINDDPSVYWSILANWTQENFPGVPMVISETGAGGIWEWGTSNITTGDPHKDQWTQPYQTKILTEDVKVALADDNISGVTLWHFFDFKTDHGECPPCEYLPDVTPPTCGYIDITCKRPGGMNHKGVVDIYRRKKQAYDAVKELYATENRPKL